MNNNYIIANIKLPIKINLDGSYDILSDNIEIVFSNNKDNILEESKNNKDSQIQLKTLIAEIITTVIENPVEIPKRYSKTLTNISFKNQHKSSKLKNFTSKKHYVI
jgi:hypothetical protein